ncbi:uncharacterized protein [Rutidosis leptorrhynchoides]|uniref:uncharacterized protein n=1 Tax=Rutidosis leptorrhynchoides TaxID=125765 RepID=UPI003A99D853
MKRHTHYDGKSFEATNGGGGRKIEDYNVAFSSSFSRTIGDGCSTSFWNDHWVGSNCLRLLFPRLFRLETQPNILVKDRLLATGSHSDQNVVAAVNNSARPSPARFDAVAAVNHSVQPTTFQIDDATDSILFSGSAQNDADASQLHRSPTGRTRSEFQELINLLSSASLDGSKCDSWSWSLASNGIFTVKKLTSIIEDHVFEEGFNGNDETIRNNLVSKKIEVFAWRSYKKRLQVLFELDKKGIDLNSVRCPLCDNGIETIEHSLIFCSHAQDVWSRVFKWWNLGSFSFVNVRELLRDTSVIAPTYTNSIMLQTIIWICAYMIWKNRNNKVFRGKNWVGSIALNEIQWLSFDWIANRCKTLKIDWHT